MTYFSKSELRKLSFVCNERMQYAVGIINSEDATALEKALATMERDYMQSLVDKLNGVARGDDKRIGVSSF